MVLVFTAGNLSVEPILNRRKKEDAEALALIQMLLAGYKVVPVDCASLVYFGGVLNCCAWNIQT